MKWIPVFLLFAMASFFSQKCIAQSDANAQITNIVEKDNKLHISYDIINAQKEELFEVEIKIVKNGETIIPSTLSGQYGKGIIGGADYKIIWDFVADSVIWDENTRVKLITNAYIDFAQYNAKTLFLSSTLLPGSGLKKIDPSREYRILGIAGYLGVGSAIFFKLRGNKTYNSYKTETDYSERSSLIDKANKSNKLAMVSASASAGIWLVNYIWLAKKWGNAKKKNTAGISNKINFYANYNPYIKNTEFTLKISF